MSSSLKGLPRAAAFMILALILCLDADAAPVNVSLPSQPLADSIRALGDLSGMTIAVDGALVQGRTAPAVSGLLEPEEALRRLLAGTGLVVHLEGDRAVITRAGQIQLGAVRVQGDVFPKGANGSTDVTATEGTGSYTAELATAGSKMPLMLHDTPQTISVLTDQQIHDQNLFDVMSALQQAPGIYILPNGPDPTIYSRGFTITNFQFDGGATFSTSFGSNIPVNPAFDMVEYDHIEVLRGADGMFAGAGDPSGTVNLVRKRPLDHFQLTGEFTGGSWDNFRETADITGPLGFDGRLRGRLAVSHQDNDYFYEVNNTHRTSVYAVIEADLTSTTLLTAGFDVSWRHDQGGDYYVPLAANGADLHLPRSFCLCAPWGRNDQRNNEVFSKVQQKLADDWTFNLNFTHAHQRQHQIDPYANFANPPYQAYELFIDEPYQMDQNMLDGNIKGGFKLFGQQQEVVIGANWKAYSTAETYLRAGGYGSPATQLNIPDIYTFNPYTDLPDLLDTIPLSSSPSSFFSNDTQWSVYGFARFSPLSFAHILGGFRISSYANIDYYNSYSSIVTQPHTDEDGIFTPYAGITIDLNSRWNVYYSYTSIFQPQPNDYFGPPPGSRALPPVTGNEHEIGIKGQMMNGRLNASLAFYQIHQINAAVQDPAYPDTDTVGAYGSCCYLAAGDLLSKGVDAELTGEILPDWQISASFNYNINRYSSQLAYGTTNGTPINTVFPPVMFKLWSTYRLPGRWSDFTVGGGVDGQSTTYGTGSVPTVLSSDDKTFVCPCVNYEFKQDPFVIVNMRVAYRFLEHWEAAFNMNNLLDKTYYARLRYPRDDNYYGEPRNFMFSISGKL